MPALTLTMTSSGPCCPKRKQNDDDEEFAASVERDGRLYEMDLFTNAQPVGFSPPIAVGGARGNDGSPQDRKCTLIFTT